MKLSGTFRSALALSSALIHVLAHFQRITCSQIYFRFSSYLLRKPHLFVILTAIGWFILNIQSDLFWHRCLERKPFGTPRMYTLSPSKSIKESNYGEFLKDKNVLLCTRLYKYTPNLESLLTQQYVCIMCTLWSDNTCVFTRFHSVKNANTQLIWSSVTGRLFSRGAPVSSTNKTDRHDITEILLKVALNTLTLTLILGNR